MRVPTWLVEDRAKDQVPPTMPHKRDGDLQVTLAKHGDGAVPSTVLRGAPSRQTGDFDGALPSRTSNGHGSVDWQIYPGDGSEDSLDLTGSIPPPNSGGRQRLCVVGPSPHFLGGITYYTFSLCEALDAEFDVSALLLRRLLPRYLYPGRARVGRSVSSLTLPDSVARFDGIDWYWIPSMARALKFLTDQQPDVVVLQWWTSTVLHSYLLLARVAKARGAKVVVEFHESLDTAEQRLRIPAWYAKHFSPRLFEMTSGYIAHSNEEASLISNRYGLDRSDIAVIPHAAYQFQSAETPARAAPQDVCNLLYFGLIRPYKGLEDLIRVFSSLPQEEAARYWLTVVGETWEGWDLPSDLIRNSPYRDRISFVNRYVDDQEVASYFAGADVVVLPYRRSCQSGPLQVAIGYGLPVVVSRVGGLVEAAAGYGGAIMTEPNSEESLLRGIRASQGLRGQRFPSVHGWSLTAQEYRALTGRLNGVPFEPVSTY